MAAMVMDKLKFCNFKLDILLSVTQSINNNDSVSLLLKQYAGLLHNELNIPNVLLYSCEQSWQPLLASGIGETLFDKISVEQDLFLFKTISTTNYEKNAYLSQFDMIIPIFHKDNALAYLLIGDSAEHPGMSFSIKHLQFIQTVTNVILVAIENKRLAKEQSKQEAFMVDLHLAARMQKLMIPEKKNLPNTDK
ncbi:MAG: Phosphoserine phosphatase RsbU, partial [Bacteroidota bacterium]